MDKRKARRIFAKARIASAQRIVDTGRLYCEDPTEERWREFQRAIDDIARLEASPLGREALAGGGALDEAVGS